jgi:hypothetical protein
MQTIVSQERAHMPLVVRRGVRCRCWGSRVRSRQGNPGFELQVFTVPSGGLVEGFDLRGCQGPVGPQVELHLAGGDATPHRGDELCVGQGHPGCGLRVRGTCPAASRTQRESW